MIALVIANTRLLTAYGLLGLLVVANLCADHWMKQVARAAEATTAGTVTPELALWVRSRTHVWSLAAAGAITLAIVFVMVVKPDLFGWRRRPRVCGSARGSGTKPRYRSCALTSHRRCRVSR